MSVTLSLNKLQMASYCLTFGLLTHSRLCRSRYYPSKNFSLASYLEFNKNCLILMKADDTRASLTFACLPLFRFDIPFLRRGGRVVLHVWSWVNFQYRGVLLIGIIRGQRSTALAVGGGGGCLDIFTLLIISLLFLPLCGRRPDIN